MLFQLKLYLNYSFNLDCDCMAQRIKGRYAAIQCSGYSALYYFCTSAKFHCTIAVYIKSSNPLPKFLLICYVFNAFCCYNITAQLKAATHRVYHRNLAIRIPFVAWIQTGSTINPLSIMKLASFLPLNSLPSLSPSEPSPNTITKVYIHKFIVEKLLYGGEKLSKVPMKFSLGILARWRISKLERGVE